MLSSSFLSLFIGLRFNRGSFRNEMVSLISLITTISISLGVAVLIIALSVMNGFEYELNYRILAVVPHGEIEAVNQPWKNWSEALQKVKKISGVSAAGPYISFIGLLENRGNVCVVQVKGIDPNQEERLSSLFKFISDSVWANFKAGENQIIIGKGVADTLKLKKNDWISVLISDGKSNANLKLEKPRRIRLHIAGVFQLSNQIDYNFAIVPIEDARRYLKIENCITGITIKVHDAFHANKFVKKAGLATDTFVYIKSWIGTYGYLYKDIKMVRTIMYLAIILLMIVACFNIISTLMIAVKEKHRDIAILLSLGAPPILIQTIFIWYGLLTGLTSSLYGTIIGAVVSLKLTSIVRNIEKLIDHQFLSGDIYFINFLPSKLYWLDVVYVLLITLSISLLASWFPARHAGHINSTNSLK